MREHLIEWLEAHTRSCAFKEQTGIYCAGCGLQRSVIALLKGNIIESLVLYPALLPILLMFAFLFLHLIFRFRAGATILKYMFVANITIIVLHYIYLLFQLKPIV
jgi:hypothetical protein